MKTTTLIIYFLCTFVVPSFAQNTTVSTVNFLLDNLLAIQKQYKDDNDPVLKDNLLKLNTNTNDLIQKMQAADSLPAQYLDEFQSYKEAFKIILSNRSQAAETAGELSRDIEIKLHAGSVAGAESGLGVAIKVTFVITESNGAKATNLQVNCNPYFWRTNTQAMYIVSNNAPPFSMSLPPGNFYLWCERNGKKLFSKEIAVGEFKNEQNINIILP